MVRCLALRPSLYRAATVVMTDGSTYRTRSAVRQVGDLLQLERDTVNHPAYQRRGGSAALVDKREQARIDRGMERERRRAARS